MGEPRISYQSEAHGFSVVTGLVDPETLEWTVSIIRKHAERFPFERPTMRDGTPLSVKVTSFGDWGWWAGFSGYRYIGRHPTTNEPWPAIPHNLRLLALAFAVAGRVPPGWVPDIDTVLVNWYSADASLGWHVDRTEADKISPILTMSIGAPAIFEIRLSGEVHRVTLNSGDGVIMAGYSRNAEHRVVRLLPPAKAAQPDLFGGTPEPPPHDPLGDGTRMSITWRRTGIAKAAQP